MPDPNDPTQQQPQPQQQQSMLPPWASRAVSGIGSGLGAALPYALPAALGGVLGARESYNKGGGAVLDTAAGALAGGLTAKGVEAKASEEEADKQAQLKMQQEELHIKAQEADIEIQKGKIALANEAEKDRFKKTIKDPVEAEIYDHDFPTWAKNKGMGTLGTLLSSDPAFKAANPTLAKYLPAMPAEMQSRMLEAALSGKYQHVLPASLFPDGKYYAQGISADGQITYIPTGKPPPMIATDERLGQAAAQFNVKQMETARASVQKNFEDMQKANDKARGWMTDHGYSTLPYPQIDGVKTFGDYLNTDAGTAAFNATLNAAPPPTGAAPTAPKADANKNLRPTGPTDKPPKNLWGTSYTGPDGVTWDIDAKGNPKRRAPVAPVVAKPTPTATPTTTSTATPTATPTGVPLPTPGA